MTKKRKGVEKSSDSRDGSTKQRHAIFSEKSSDIRSLSGRETHVSSNYAAYGKLSYVGVLTEVKFLLCPGDDLLFYFSASLSFSNGFSLLIKSCCQKNYGV
ncbi:hypothetical protein AVEN_55509-1 [Araneus ventricosus]|uniref:Uncharacterized protein n=1 Tax=Araneus ventricosus TaxID=182803 RepID=A0A4Y2CAW9_ARAVE|nr:hypothetical protein AVEN_55509-1 [Araneus ventricosus]